MQGVPEMEKHDFTTIMHYSKDCIGREHRFILNPKGNFSRGVAIIKWRNEATP